MERTIEVGKKYKHFKGTIYEVVMFAKNSETLEKEVIYEHGDDIWVRTYDMFNSLVDKKKYPNTTQKYRFEEVKD